MEQEVIRYAAQGVQYSFRLVRGGAQAAMRMLAFLKALFNKIRIESGERSLRFMLKKGEAVNVGSIPKDSAESFARISKEYGLPYHTVLNEKKGTLDIMFRNSDMPKFNSVIERLDIVDKVNDVDEYVVEDVREDLFKRIDRVKAERYGEMERKVDRKMDGMSHEEVSHVIKDININNLGAYSPDNWRIYLETQALLYDYTPSNKRVIYEQKPNATLVKSEDYWKNTGRMVDIDKGIELRIPVLANGVSTGDYRVQKVYDISDTEGDATKLTAHFQHLKTANISELNSALIKSNNVVLSEKLEVDAIFDPEQNAILLRSGLDSESKFNALQRESVYAKCFAEHGVLYNREDNRLIAESCSYVAAMRYGIRANDDKFKYKFDYIDEMVQFSPKQLLTSKVDIDKYSTDISKQLNQVLHKDTLDFGER